MSAIILPQRYYTQPHGRCSVAEDWVQRGLSAAIIPHKFSYSHIASDLFNNGAQITASSAGIGASTNAASQQYLTIPVALPATPNMTLVFVGRPTSASGTQRAINLSAGTHQRFNFQFVNGGQSLEAAIANANGANAYYVFGGASPFTAKISNYVVIFYRVGTAARAKIFVDGVLFGDAFIANEATPSISSTRLDIGRLFYNGTAYYGNLAAVNLGAAINDAIDDSAAASLSANPWQLFKADPVRIYSFPIGPIIPTITSVGMTNILQNSATANIQLTF